MKKIISLILIFTMMFSYEGAGVAAGVGEEGAGVSNGDKKTLKLVCTSGTSTNAVTLDGDKKTLKLVWENLFSDNPDFRYVAVLMGKCDSEGPCEFSEQLRALVTACPSSTNATSFNNASAPISVSGNSSSSIGRGELKISLLQNYENSCITLGKNSWESVVDGFWVLGEEFGLKRNNATRGEIALAASLGTITCALPSIYIYRGTRSLLGTLKRSFWDNWLVPTGQTFSGVYFERGSIGYTNAASNVTTVGKTKAQVGQHFTFTFPRFHPINLVVDILKATWNLSILNPLMQFLGYMMPSPGFWDSEYAKSFRNYLADLWERTSPNVVEPGWNLTSQNGALIKTTPLNLEPSYGGNLLLNIHRVMMCGSMLLGDVAYNVLWVYPKFMITEHPYISTALILTAIFGGGGYSLYKLYHKLYQLYGLMNQILSLRYPNVDCGKTSFRDLLGMVQNFLEDYTDVLRDQESLQLIFSIIQKVLYPGESIYLADFSSEEISNKIQEGIPLIQRYFRVLNLLGGFLGLTPVTMKETSIEEIEYLCGLIVPAVSPVVSRLKNVLRESLPDIPPILGTLRQNRPRRNSL